MTIQLGAHLRDDGVSFAVYSTIATRVSVLLWRDLDAPPREIELAPAGDHVYVAHVDDARAGDRYRIRLDDVDYPDPYARSLPEGVHGRAEIVDLRRRFRHRPVPRPLARHVIYELHVGTFTEEGTFRAAMKRLPYLADLGVTMIELMPIAAFAGEHGWGYDGVALFAPHAAYGTAQDLFELVDEAHRLGLSICLDVVYNHLGPSGNYLAAFSPAYFAEGHSPWGQSFDWTHPVVRALVIDSALQWLDTFGFDALRLDAVHWIEDPSPTPILAELAARVASLEPKRLLIAEDERNDPTPITEWKLDGMWSDDFHHQVRVTLTGERDGYYAAFTPGVADLARTIERGWLFEGQFYPPFGKPRGKPADGVDRASLVYCLDNHDQVGNRAAGDRLSRSVSLETYCAVSLLLLLLPSVPLIFMGQEWYATTPFAYFTDHDVELGRKITEGRRKEFAAFVSHGDPSLVPDPQARETFERSRLDWNEVSRAPHARVHALHRTALLLRRSDPYLGEAARSALTARTAGDVLIVERRIDGDVRIIVTNLGSTDVGLGELGIAEDVLPMIWSTEEAPGAVVPRQSTVVLVGRSPPRR